MFLWKNSAHKYSSIAHLSLLFQSLHFHSLIIALLLDFLLPFLSIDLILATPDFVIYRPSCVAVTLKCI